MSRNQNILRQLDWFTIALWVIIVLCGWFTIYSACYDFEKTEFFNFSQRHCQQFVWICCSLVLAIFMLAIDTKFFGNVSIPLYALTLGLLVLTIFIAPDVKGSHSWIQLGGFRFQPAEIAKYATALCLAKVMSVYGFNIKKTSHFLLTVLVIGLPMLIIIAQQETGSALVFAIFILVLFREGLNGDLLVFSILAALFFILVVKYNNIPPDPSAVCVEHYGYLIVFSLAVIAGFLYIFRYSRDSVFFKTYIIVNVVVWSLCLLLKMTLDSIISYTTISIISVATSAVTVIVFMVIRRSKVYLVALLLFLGTGALAYGSNIFFNNVLQPHQQVRIKIVLGLEDDPKGAGYNVTQAKIAIGSGGFFGKGFLNGTQTKLNYVPEQDTDFIFCTVGEEQGFVGASFVIVLYLLFICRLYVIAERQRTPFSRIYGYSVASIFFIHFTINIGMVIGILPVIGIPLPFFSYGGSSMIAFTILLFTLLKLDTHRMDTMAA